MFNVAMRITKDYMDAEDVLQEAFVRAFRSLGSFKGESTFGAWLKRIVINTSINSLNKKKDIWADIDKHAAEIPEEDAQEAAPAWDMETIRKKILMLPEGYRVVFNLYLIEGYDHTEIGDILNISEATSKSQYHRAKKKLRELLESEDGSWKIGERDNIF